MKQPCSLEQRIAMMALLLGMHLANCPWFFGLDSRLDVSQYAHANWRVRDGFVKSQISSIAQTPDGYIWLATDFGLVRFDGKRFVPWQPPTGQHLPSISIFRLLAARDGTLWIGAAKGLASWKNGKLTHYPELDGKYIFALLEDHEGSVWASGVEVTGGKLCAIRNGSVQCYGDDGVWGRAITNLYEDSKGNLWAGVATGLWRWRPGPPKFFSLPGEPDGIQALGEDSAGTLLVGWKGGLKCFRNGKLQDYAIPGFKQPLKARRILRDREGGVWIGTSSQGLVHLHQGGTDVFRQSDGLSGDSINAILEDHEGNLWVSTLDGLDRFGNFIVSTFSVRQGLSNSIVFSVLADKDGDIWLGTAGGLDKWHNGQITTYDKHQGKLNGRDPNSLFQDRQGRIWVSTQEGFGYLENNRWNSIRNMPGGPVLSIVQDRAGSLWVANEQFGLFELQGTKMVRHIRWGELGHKDHASVIAADPAQGGLWIGFFLGGVAYIKDGQVRASYSMADGLGEGQVSSFQLEADGTLWIGTESGLSRLKDGRLITLTDKNGLPCSTVNWVIEDDARSLWLYTQCGLVRIDRKELDSWALADQNNNHSIRAIQPTTFDNFDGVRSLASGGHLNPQVAKSPDGKLWFLPWDGVSVIDPSHLSVNNFLPPVNIEQITANGKSYDAASATNGKLRLPPLLRDLQIDYTALSFAAPEKVFFRYKLERFDPDWKEAGTRRQAFYNNLSPGNYRFRVIACNNSGIWNQEGAILDFSVAPGYYQTGWFRALCVVVGAAFIWAVLQLRQRQMQRQFNMRLDARVNERTRIARELHDTLLQSFHGLVFRFQAARNMLPRRPEEAMQALDGAIMKAEEAMTESRSAIQDLRSEAAHADLVESFTAIGRQLASQNGDGTPHFHVIVEGEQRKLAHAFQPEVYRMGRELLQNAFRHARAREIEAEIRYDRRMFCLRIRDDGRGIDPKVLAQGGRPGHWGLPGVQERAKQIGAQLDFWSEVGAGTEVQLTIPAKIAYEEFQDRSKFRLFRKAKSEGS
ncbi:MAG TPA: two-component regulator propeller domain-containing protein [Candidatus Angelobacter sp.]|jgi:signal transduction histidine kinase/ligand-binding sensor domain-containing protein|nr:two-component regulator propeller domain-containing protein [Candidatus Angelobacter sp.]